MRLRIVDSDAPPLPNDDPKFPQIHFQGVAIGTQFTQAHVEGFVHRFKNGMIRWHFVSLVVLERFTSLITTMTPRTLITMGNPSGGEAKA